MKFLDPTNDYAFKRIFGNENKKEILISFLNSLLGLEGEKTIEGIDLLTPCEAPQIKDLKETILDVRCRDQRGVEYIVEMQVLKRAYFDKRIQFYTSRVYTNQLNSGEEYDKLNPVIFIGILNFGFTQNGHYISQHLMRDVETNEHILRDFSFHFVELPKFVKGVDELETVTDKWIYFLKHAPDLEVVPEVIHEAAIKEAFDIVDRSNWAVAEVEAYDRHGMARTDAAMAVKHHYETGLEEGHEKGLAEGLEKGQEQGDQKARLRIAQEMLEQGMEVTLICKLTGLSREDLL